MRSSLFARGNVMGIGRRRTAVIAGVVAGAVLAAGTVLWATDSGPFRASYCWGAWQQDSGPSFLGDEALEKSGSKRRATESAAPSPARPRGTCTVSVASEMADDDSDGSLSFREAVTLEYGTAPAGVKERRDWLARYFHGSASPLPDGLDGLVAADRGLLVLPRACDDDGEPTVVTIRGEGSGDGHLGKVAMPFTIGTRAEVLGMLLDAANTGMEKAGCAPSHPLRSSSPIVTVAEDDERAGTPLCRIPGMTFDYGDGSRYEQQVGAVTDRLQTCSVVWETLRMPDEPSAQYVMASGTRLADLFRVLPEGSAQGLVRRQCGGRPTVFYGHVEAGLQDRGRPSDRRVFERFVESVEQRIGCGSGEDA
ncbi:hypothetical protein MHW47_16000 [Streptomyces sp. OfavH-34-F]|uniref:hypothetical protein n=1 Tax=Streptomyces sp. OfavH-34-F TaxID=2917760 RepID=UPI001EF250D4|nr:hypothetical protein [Streptomyces sp. OfavH-34-F]MCG7525939.1 hypothetical protein [Streptomyces sp. OfavH-34-F]